MLLAKQGPKNNFLPHLPKLNNLNWNIFQHKKCLLNVQRPLSEMCEVFKGEAFKTLLFLFEPSK